MPSEGVGRAVSLGIDLGKLVRLDKEIPALPASETLITVHRIGETSLHVTRINPLVRAQGVVPQVTRAPDCWEQVRRKTTLTIVDSPPLTDSFDGLAVSGLVDRVVVIMEAESTRLPVVSELCDRLTQQQAPIAGVVFNKRRFYIPRFIYRWL
jgi:protein-tyrosine kinase